MKLIFVLFFFWGAVSFVQAQQSENFCFKIDRETYTSFPKINIGFTYFEHETESNIRELFNTGKIKLSGNGKQINSIVIEQQNQKKIPNVYIIIDSLSEQDSNIVKELKNYIAFPNLDTIFSKIKTSVLIAKNKQIIALPLNKFSDIGKKEIFSISVENNLLLDYCVNNSLLNSNNVFIFFENNFTPLKLERLSQIISQTNSTTPPLFAFLVSGNINISNQKIETHLGEIPFVLKKIVIADTPKKSKILSFKSHSSKNKAEFVENNSNFNIAPLISSWINRKYKLTFNTQSPISLNTYNEYLLSIDNNTSISTISFHLSFPKDIVENYYLTVKIKEITTLIDSLKFNEALQLNITTSNQINSSTLDSLAWLTIYKYGQYLANSNDTNAYPKYNEFEAQWQKENPNNYKSKKIALYKLYYNNYQVANVQYSKMIELADTIYKMQPNNENKFNLTVNRAYKCQAENKNWEALALFKKAIEIKEDKLVEKSLKEQLYATFSDEYKNKLYRNISTYGANYKKWFIHPFRQNYILAEAYQKTNKNTEAQKQYEWLINNWCETSYLNWFELFEKLQNILIMNYEFEKAIELNQKIYRNNNKTEAIELCLFSSRAIFLKPIIDIFPIAYTRIGSFSKIKKGINLNTITIPTWLAGITLTNSNLKPLVQLYKTNDYKTKPKINLANIKNFPTVLMDVANKNFWLINKISNNQFVVLQIANKNCTTEEKTYISEIVKSKMTEQLWLNLFRTEEKTGVKFFSQMLCALWEVELSQKNTIALNSYWNKLRQSDYIQYLVFHENNDKEVTKGKPMQLQLYSGNNYIRSSETKAYFEQLLRDENNTYIDICNPL